MTYRIKPLEWMRALGSSWVASEALGVGYSVTRGRSEQEWVASASPADPAADSYTCGTHPTQEAAMAACQRDWESTLKEYLEEA